jgi:hypothetical protein
MTERKFLRRRAPAAALGSATTRFGDWARPFPGRDRKSQLVPSLRGRARIAGGATTGSLALPIRQENVLRLPFPHLATRGAEQRPVGRKEKMSLSLRTVACGSDPAARPRRKTKAGPDWTAIHGPTGAQVALLQSPILPLASPTQTE